MNKLDLLMQLNAVSIFDAHSSHLRSRNQCLGRHTKPILFQMQSARSPDRTIDERQDRQTMIFSFDEMRMMRMMIMMVMR